MLSLKEIQANSIINYLNDLSLRYNDLLLSCLDDCLFSRERYYQEMVNLTDDEVNAIEIDGVRFVPEAVAEDSDVYDLAQLPPLVRKQWQQLADRYQEGEQKKEGFRADLTQLLCSVPHQQLLAELKDDYTAYVNPEGSSALVRYQLYVLAFLSKEVKEHEYFRHSLRQRFDQQDKLFSPYLAKLSWLQLIKLMTPSPTAWQKSLGVSFDKNRVKEVMRVQKRLLILQ